MNVNFSIGSIAVYLVFGVILALALFLQPGAG